VKKLTTVWVRHVSYFLSVVFLIGAGEAIGHPPSSDELFSVEEQKDFDGNFSADDTAAIQEEHTLEELIFKDPEKNLAYQHPSIVMNAAQKIASWINYGGETTISDPEYGNGNVRFYRTFSGGIKEADGKMINGQYGAIQSFVDYVFAAARGDGSSSKMLLLVGPAGTGKTYFMSILQAVAHNLSSTYPDYFTYTYEWKNLKEYPELRQALNIQNEGSQDEFEHPFPCPIHESPINLIPKIFAKKAISLALEKATKMARARPTPRQYHCPQCQHIRDVIIKNYKRKNGLSNLRPDQEVAVLSPHITVKRMVVGYNGSMAKLDAEPKDVDYQGLLTSPNAFVFQSFGQAHPMSYYLSGKMLQANGNILLMDEFFRDDEGFRDQALNLIEEKAVRRGGAPEVKLDTLVIGASNYESIEKALAAGNAVAHLDRTLRVRMPYLLNPVLEAKNLLMMKNINTVTMQALGSTLAHNSADDGTSLLISSSFPQPNAGPVPADLEALFPLPKAGEVMSGPDHHYKLWFDMGPSMTPVHLSPHTLMYVAMTVAGSRLVTDPALAIKYGEKGVIKDAAYRDVFTRLKVLKREYTSINASDLNDLRSLSRDLNEGDFGISERDAANVWLTGAIAEAQRPENGNCLSPNLARKVFRRLLEEKAIRYPDLKTRLRWEHISNEIMTKYLIPEVQNDVHTAFGAGPGAVNSVYDEIFQEILALSMDRKAEHYHASNGDLRQINKRRLEEIQEIYRNSQHREFEYGEVTAYALANKEGDNKRHSGLRRAVQNYLAKRATELVTFDDIQKFSENHEGSSMVRERASEIGQVMAHDLGYCDKCMKSALMLLRQETSRTEQVQR